MGLLVFRIRRNIWTMARNRWVSVTPSPNQNKIKNILKFTYSQSSSQINLYAFIININIVKIGRSRQASVTPSKIRNKINNIIGCYKNNWYLSPEEFIRAKLNSHHQGNHHNQNKKANLDCNKILRLRIKLRQLIICHDTHPNDVNDNDEHPNDVNNIDTEKKQWCQKKWHAP